MVDATASEEACCSATVQAVVAGGAAQGALSLQGDAGITPDLLLVKPRCPARQWKYC